MEQTLKVTWGGSGAPPTCPPNPEYPQGKPIDFTKGEAKHCTVDLPWPAKGIGHYVIECPKCGIRVACTTAGRADDPSSARVPCFANYLSS